MKSPGIPIFRGFFIELIQVLLAKNQDLAAPAIP